MNSMRGRLALTLAMGLLTIFVLSGALLYAYLYTVLWKGFDNAVLEKAKAFALTTEFQDNNIIEFEFIESDLPEYRPHRKAEYFQVWRPDGTVVVRSPSLGNDNLPAPLPNASYPAFSNLQLPDGRKGRAVTLGFYPRPGNDLVPVGEPASGKLIVSLAMSRGIVDRTLGKIRKGLLITCLAFFAGTLPLILWSVRAGLRSLDVIGEQVRGVDAENLAFRFHPGDMPRELAPICERLNDLLERLNEAFNRERRFTANAAHELRTPIAELKTLAEVGLGEARRGALGMEEYFLDAVEVAKHLEHLTETLLAMARCEAGIQMLQWQWVEVSRVLQELWTPLLERMGTRTLKTSATLAGDVLVQTDAALFRALLTNLLENALAYTPDEGEIHLSLSRQDSTFFLTVANTSDYLNPDDVNHLFEPFWRKAATSREGGAHCGVGLSLVAAYAKVLGISLHAQLTPSSFLEITLSGSLEKNE